MTEKEFVSLSKELIEEKFFPHKHGEKLSQRDFNDLSVQIEEKCGIVLSLSTLKRLWKDDFKQPHPATLDALVSILGFAQWNDFKRVHQKTLASPKYQSYNKAKKTIKGYFITLASSAFMIILAFVYLSFIDEDNTPIRVQGPFSLTVDKTVASGVPNTVVFNYDVNQVRADSFFIQQSWDKRYKEKVQATNTHLSSVYYYPGFHKAKLIANDSILSVKPIHITTNGWLPLAYHGYYPKIPQYISGEVINDGGLYASTEQLQAAGIDSHEDYTLSFFNVRDFNDLPSTDFQLSCTMLLDKLEHSICPVMEVRLLCEKHIFYLQFAENGCVGKLSHKIGEKVLDGKYSDFSGFGVKAGEWQNIKLKIENKQAVVSKEGKEIYRTHFNESLGNIKGIVFSFDNALGSISEVALENTDGETIYSEVLSKRNL